VAKTNPSRAVEACGCGTLPSSSDAHALAETVMGLAGETPLVERCTNGPLIMSCAILHLSTSSSAERGGHDVAPMAASAIDGQAPTPANTSPRGVSRVGVVRAPPGCDLATTPPLIAGSVWHVDPRAVALPPKVHVRAPAIEVDHVRVVALANDEAKAIDTLEA
jgi:hypothetical protein